MKITDRILRQLGVSFVAEQAGISEFRLNANSMKILLVPDPSARAVCVVQHVNVGSRHEGAGNTGYSHLLEHMLFKGTPSHNAARGNSYDDLMKRLGGIYNATTSVDRTNYYAKVPSAFLGEYLAHEADRLRNAIIIDDDLRTEMPVVVDEFDIGENDPDQITEKLMNATAFTEHPYKVDTIGSRSEVMQVTAASLKEKLYEVYYHPNNVTLILVGGFDALEALGLIVKYYGHIPPSPRPIPPMYTVEPQQFGERRFVINKAGDLPRVVIGFHIPQADHEDTQAIAALATILGGTPASRLYRKLVNSGLASSAGSYARETHDPGLFQVFAKLNPGVKPKTVERIILAEIDRMCDKLVGKAELTRTKVQNLAGTVHLRANPLRFAQQLSEQEAVADWRWGANYDAAFDGLTAERIREVAQRYLTADNRTVGYFLPKAAAPITPKPEDTTPAPTPEPQQTPTPAPAPGKDTGNAGGTASFAEQVKKVVLPNGLTVLLLPTQTESAIGVHLALSAGRSYAPADKRLVPGIVAQMLPRGSKKFSKARIAEMTSEMLVRFGFNESAFRSELSTHVVPADMPRFLDLLSDVLVNPLFREDELALLKTSIAAELEEAVIDPGSRASTALRQSFYADAAAFGAQSIEAQSKLLPTVTVDELRAFHAKFYSPKGSVLALVGKFDPDAMLATLTAKFGAWTGNDVPEPVAVSSGSPAARAVNINIEGKDNLTILVGLPADISVHSPEYLAAMLANKALGGDTLTSRLGKEIREKRGLTYGITSRFADPTVAGGLWVVSMTTNAGKLSEALPLIRQIVEEYVREGIGEAELEQEREALINAFALNLDAPVSIASQIAQCELTGRGVATMDTYESRAKAVTKADVDAVIRKCFRIGDAVTVVAGTLPA